MIQSMQYKNTKHLLVGKFLIFVLLDFEYHI